MTYCAKDLFIYMMVYNLNNASNCFFMINLPNLISISRIPLAFCFLQNDPIYRLLGVCLALITDGLDGFLARRYDQSSFLGTLLDPLTDKFFVIMGGIVLINEGRLSLVEACMLVSRDFALLFFGAYLLLQGNLTRYRFRAIWTGKITTVLQFGVLLALIWGMTIPPFLYGVFVALGFLALLELYLRDA